MRFNNLFNDTRSIDALLRDIRRLITQRKYERTENGIVVNLGAKTMLGGVFDISAGRDIAVQKAMDDGDDDLVAYLQRGILSGLFRREDYTFGAALDPNLMPDSGLNFILGLIVPNTGTTVSKKAALYISAFRSDWTPAATADANWAGASSGPVANEISASYVTATARLGVTFGAAASKSAASTTATYTVKSGVTGLSVYGGTLNSSSTFGYDTAYDGVNGHVLYAATRRGSAISGLQAADTIAMAYTLSATSA